MVTKVRFLGKSNPVMLIHGKVYQCLGQEDDCYRVIDEEEEDYLYPIDLFEVIEEVPFTPVQIER